MNELISDRFDTNLNYCIKIKAQEFMTDYSLTWLFAGGRRLMKNRENNDWKKQERDRERER